MNNPPLVSILVPVYCVEQYIERCARSLFEQDYANLEYVFVDDCSPDKSIEVLKNVCQQYPLLKERIKVLHNEANSGAFLSRKNALKASTGEWIIYVDSDDFLPSSAVTTLVNASIKNEADVVMGRLSLYREGNYEVLKSKHGKDNYDHICMMLRKETGIGVASRLIKRELLVNSPIPYDSIGNISFGEDFVVAAICYYNSKKITWIDDVVYYYEKGNSNSGTTRYSLKTVTDLIQSREIVYSYFNNLPDSDRYAPSIRIGMGKARIWVLENTDFSSEAKLKNQLKQSKGDTFRKKVVLFLIDYGWYSVAKKMNRIMARLNM